MIEDALSRSSADRYSIPVEQQKSGPVPSLFSGPKDLLLTAAEWSARQIYWRSSRLRTWMKNRRTNQPVKAQVADRQILIEHLRQLGVTAGSLVMAHTSTSGLSLTTGTTPDPQPVHALRVAQDLLSVLQGLVGDAGTLVMPTHPVYKVRPMAVGVVNPLALPVYNPASTPCGVGLANELFWRQSGTERSLFPHNTLAAKGPLAEALLLNNLHDLKPLAHGVDSGYYRFCQRNGLLVSIGVPLGSCFTLVHAAEEVRDQNWPVKDFFEERDYLIRQGGVDRTVTIRKTRTEFMKFSLCIRKLRRDLVRAGILHEGYVGSVRVDSARAGEIFDFLSQRNRSSTYPYFGTSLVSRQEHDHASKAHS